MYHEIINAVCHSLKIYEIERKPIKYARFDKSRNRYLIFCVLFVIILAKKLIGDVRVAQ